MHCMIICIFVFKKKQKKKHAPTKQGYIKYKIPFFKLQRRRLYFKSWILQTHFANFIYLWKCTPSKFFYKSIKNQNYILEIIEMFPWLRFQNSRQGEDQRVKTSCHNLKQLRMLLLPVGTKVFDYYLSKRLYTIMSVNIINCSQPWKKKTDWLRSVVLCVALSFWVFVKYRHVCNLTHSKLTQRGIATNTPNVKTK